MNALVCSCRSFVELSSAFRSLSGDDNLARLGEPSSDGPKPLDCNFHFNLGEDTPLTLEHILDETNQLDVGSKTKYWLETEALKNNPKLSCSTGPSGLTTYLFKPPFNIVNRKGLLKLLKQYHIKGTMLSS